MYVLDTLVPVQNICTTKNRTDERKTTHSAGIWRKPSLCNLPNYNKSTQTYNMQGNSGPIYFLTTAKH